MSTSTSRMTWMVMMVVSLQTFTNVTASTTLGVRGTCDAETCVEGTCSGVPPTCVCKHGFGGTFCDIPTSPCDNYKCRHGECKEVKGNATCECEAYWTGDHCTAPVASCDEEQSPCFNDGECVDTDTVPFYYCDCTNATVSKFEMFGDHCNEVNVESAEELERAIGHLAFIDVAGQPTNNTGILDINIVEDIHNISELVVQPGRHGIIRGDKTSDQRKVINATGTGSWLFRLETASHVEFHDLVFEGGDASGTHSSEHPGGGLFLILAGVFDDRIGLTPQKTTFERCTFRNGTAPLGGAVHSMATVVQFIDCEAYNNTATQSGGAFYNKEGDMVVKTSTLNTNEAHGDQDYQGGGAIYNNGRLHIVESHFDGNRCTGALCRGGALYNYEHAFIYKSSLEHNHAYLGTVIFNEESTLQIGESDIRVQDDNIAKSGVVNLNSQLHVDCVSRWDTTLQFADGEVTRSRCMTATPPRQMFPKDINSKWNMTAKACPADGSEACSTCFAWSLPRPPQEPSCRTCPFYGHRFDMAGKGLSCANCTGNSVLTKHGCVGCGASEFPKGDKCEACASRNCSGPCSVAHCKSCLEGFILAGNGTCSNCPTGLFSFGGLSPACQSCESRNCTVCDSTHCTACVAGFGVTSDGVCARCPRGTYSLGGEDACQRCRTPTGACSTCDGATGLCAVSVGSSGKTSLIIGMTVGGLICLVGVIVTLVVLGYHRRANKYTNTDDGSPEQARKPVDALTRNSITYDGITVDVEPQVRANVEAGANEPRLEYLVSNLDGLACGLSVTCVGINIIMQACCETIVISPTEYRFEVLPDDNRVALLLLGPDLDSIAHSTGKNITAEITVKVHKHKDNEGVVVLQQYVKFKNTRSFTQTIPARMKSAISTFINNRQETRYFSTEDDAEQPSIRERSRRKMSVVWSKRPWAAARQTAKIGRNNADIEMENISGPTTDVWFT